MPNWCNNTVRITGKNSEIKRIEKAIKEDGFLQYLHPMPKELDDTTADGTKREELIKATGASDWYDWRTTNWSTKWEVSRDYAEPEIEEMDEHEAILTWSFDSAWAPPIGAYDHYLGNNSDMTIFATYYEQAVTSWECGTQAMTEVIIPETTNQMMTSGPRKMDNCWTTTTASWNPKQSGSRTGD
jgi:hypothetical protein